MKLRNAQGILSSQVPTGNLLWVDAINGVDALAARGRLMFPFKKLGTAKAKAISGDTIIVMPGVYNENNLAKNGVNWHFFSGASVEYSGTGAALFDTTQSGSAGAFKITGSGVFKTTNVSTYLDGFYIANSSDDVKLEFDRIETKGVGINCVSGIVRASGNEVKSTGSSAIYIGDAPESVLTINRIESTASSALYLDGNATSTLRVRAAYITSSGLYALIFKGGNAYIDAFEINSTTTITVYYNSSNSDPLHLRVARIINMYNSTGARAVSIGSGSDTNSGAIRLYGCTLFSKYGDYSIASYAGDAKDALCFGQCVIKKGFVNVTARIFTFLDVTSNPAVGDL